MIPSETALLRTIIVALVQPHSAGLADTESRVAEVEGLLDRLMRESSDAAYEAVATARRVMPNQEE